MNRVAIAASAILLFTDASSTLAAQQQPGLWKVTTNAENSEQGKLDPQTRALMRGHIPGIDGQPTITETCVTPEMLSDVEKFKKVPHAKGLTCSEKVTETGLTEVREQVCHGLFDLVSKLSVTRKDDKHTEAFFHSRSVIRGKVKQDSIHMISEFLNPDCGDVKPYHPKFLIAPETHSTGQ